MTSYQILDEVGAIAAARAYAVANGSDWRDGTIRAETGSSRGEPCWLVWTDWSQMPGELDWMRVTDGFVAYIVRSVDGQVVGNRAGRFDHFFDRSPSVSAERLNLPTDLDRLS